MTDITVKMSLRNMVETVTFEEKESTLQTKSGTKLIKMMEELRDADKNFTFTSKEFPGLGAYIESINGLEQNTTLHYYWAIGKMVDGHLQLLPVGASSYYPEKDEHIVFAYFTQEMFGAYSKCGPSDNE